MRKETYQRGELDQTVTFFRPARDEDDSGGAAITFQTIATVWAHVRPMSGREREHSDRLNAQANYLIVIRARDDLEESDIAEWEGQRFNLRFIKNRPRSRFLEIEAERGVAY